MAWFVKTEKFTKGTIQMSPEERKLLINLHKIWVTSLIQSGLKIVSGYLIDEKKAPGGGGFLIINASSFQEAKSIVEEDPMIINKLVNWELSEWVPIAGDLFK